MAQHRTDHWICSHGITTGYFPVPGHPMMIEHRSCEICCEEISEWLEKKPEALKTR